MHRGGTWGWHHRFDRIADNAVHNPDQPHQLDSKPGSTTKRLPRPECIKSSSLHRRHNHHTRERSHESASATNRILRPSIRRLPPSHRRPRRRGSPSSHGFSADLQIATNSCKYRDYIPRAHTGTHERAIP